MATVSTSGHFLVLLCGGTGPRLWPLSRSDNPKQFLPILSPDSLLLQTLKRSLKIAPKENIFIVSNARYTSKIKKEVGILIPSKNLIFEPEKKNTAQAIIFALSKLKDQNPNSTVSVLPSDHYIPDISRFKKDLHRASVLATDTKSLVAIGIRANLPNPSYGYLVPGNKINQYYRCKKFIEKPDKISALKLIIKGAYWNSGIYTATISTFIKEFQIYAPHFYRSYLVLSKSSGNTHIQNMVYRQSPFLPFDKVISEKTNNLIFFPASFKWNDIGEWKSIFQESPKLKNNITLLNPQTSFLGINSQKCLVSGQQHKLIGLVGVNNLAIIDTPDALLVCNIAQNDSYNVRDLVSLITKDPKLKKYFLSDEKK